VMLRERWMAPAIGGSFENSSTSNTEFAAFIERHAGIMQQSGWTQEASGLRKWLPELRHGLPHRAPNGRGR
jgi:hypothetical protein